MITSSVVVNQAKGRKEEEKMSPIAETRLSSPVDERSLQPVHVVAKFLSLSRSKVYQLMEAGLLPYVKLGKSRRVRWADVLQLVEQNTIVRS